MVLPFAATSNKLIEIVDAIDRGRANPERIIDVLECIVVQSKRRPCVTPATV